MARIKKSLTDIEAAKLERRAIMVDSSFPNVSYAVDRESKGMWLFVNGVEIPIDATNVVKFAQEILDVWDLYKK